MYVLRVKGKIVQNASILNKFPVDKKHKINYNLYDIMKILLKGIERSGKADYGFKRRT